MEQTFRIIPAEERHSDDILALNAANVSVLAPMDRDRLLQLRGMAELFQAVEVEGKTAAFLIALREGQPYWSENYKWFSNHFPNFLYVDRIVIDGRYRKYGLGRKLYEGVFDHAKSTNVPVVTAEIDTAPVYNTASIKFHAAMGFREVGTQAVRHGTITVSLQAREVD